MVDPTKFTNYNRTNIELEEAICFCLCVAGHTAKTVAKHLDQFFIEIHKENPKIKDFSPFKAIRKFNVEEIRFYLKKNGIGSHGLRSKGLHYLANSKLDLRTCTRDELLKVPGIGMKTASFFILHTRQNVCMACLDRHIMRWLFLKGHKDLTDNTPPTYKKYLQVESFFLKYVEELKTTPAQLDLKIWNESVRYN